VRRRRRVMHGGGRGSGDGNGGDTGGKEATI